MKDTTRDTKYPSAKKYTHSSRQRLGMGPYYTSGKIQGLLPKNVVDFGR